MKRIIKLSSLVLIFLISLPALFAIPKLYYHEEDIIVKFYSPEINKTMAMDNLQKVPAKYYDGVRAILFFPERRVWGLNIHAYGLYYMGFKTIHINGEPKLSVLVHELAHHQQNLNGDSYYEMMNHEGDFDKYYQQIWDEVDLN